MLFVAQVKLFLINLVLAKVQQRNEIALAVASSRIVATLLTGGGSLGFQIALKFDEY